MTTKAKPSKSPGVKKAAAAKTPTAAKKAAKKAPTTTAPTAVTKAPAATTREKRVTKSTPAKGGTKLSLVPKPVAVGPVIPHDEIALRAYFIGERRQQLGWPGDSATDWADAVSQLRAEALEKPLKKR